MRRKHTHTGHLKLGFHKKKVGFGHILKNVDKWEEVEDNDMIKWQLWNVQGVWETSGWSDGIG